MSGLLTRVSEWATRIHDRDSALKVEISRYLAQLPGRMPTSGPIADELDLFREVVIDGIITTNFDSLLETLFPEFRVFVGQDQLLFAGVQGVGEIYKIHGSTSDPDSLVLTAQDYERFHDRNPYLAAKLLTTFVEHPIIFLGYSLTDPNVTSVIRSIASCLTQENIDRLRDQMVFVQWDRTDTPRSEPYSLVVDEFVVPVQRIVVNDFVGTFKALSEFRRTFPANTPSKVKGACLRTSPIW